MRDPAVHHSANAPIEQKIAPVEKMYATDRFKVEGPWCVCAGMMILSLFAEHCSRQ